MRKYGVLLMVLVLAATSLLAAAAYNTATVTNAGTLYVNTTEWSLLGLQPWTGVGNDDHTAEVVDGMLVFKFGKSLKDWHPYPGLQKNSVYEWCPLFRVLNLSAETIDLTLSASTNLAPYITFGWAGNGTNPGTCSWGTPGGSYTLTNLPENTRPWICVRVSIPAGYTGTVGTGENAESVGVTGSILVTGVAR